MIMKLLRIARRNASITPSPRTGWMLLSLLLIVPGLASARTVEGEVLSLDREKLALEVQLSGESEPRTVSVGPGDAAIANAGDRFRGELVRQGPNWRLEALFPNDPAEVALLTRLGEDLRRDTLRRGRGAFRSVGENLPPFALWDQNGALFQSESLRGNYVIMNFVFTRCTMQNMCPAATERMLDLADQIRARGWEDVRLVSVTLDPAYDTPGIWTTYAETRGIDSSLHYLLGGPEPTVEFLKQQMGVLAEPDEEQIVRHTMSTALINPTGRIIYRLPGSMWNPDTFVQQIERAREN